MPAGPHLNSHYNLGFGSWAVHTACVRSSLACGTHQAAEVQKREGADEASQPASQPETRPLRSTEVTEFTLRGVISWNHEQEALSPGTTL